MIIVLAINIRYIYYYETPAEDETMNAARYPEVLNGPIGRWHSTVKHAIWLLNNNARSHYHTLVTFWIEQKISDVGFGALAFLI